MTPSSGDVTRDRSDQTLCRSSAIRISVSSVANHYGNHSGFFDSGSVVHLLLLTLTEFRGVAAETLYPRVALFTGVPGIYHNNSLDEPVFLSRPSTPHLPERTSRTAQTVASNLLLPKK